MNRLRLICGALVLTWIAGAGQLRADDQEMSAKDRLSKAIKLCEEGNYQESHEILIGIDEDEIEGEGAQL